MNNTIYNQLKENLDYLSLKQMSLHLDDVIDRLNTDSISAVEALVKLTNFEIDLKQKNLMISMVKIGNFPYLKTIEDYDFEFQPTVNKQQILDFITFRFMENASNLIFIGNSGVGKTHLASSIGISAAKNRKLTYFIKCHDLIMQLKKAKLENRLATRIKHFRKYKLLIIDEMGFLPIDVEDSKLLFQLIDARYEKLSTIITTNLPIDKWESIFGEAMISSAIIDRLLHHSHIINIVGDSYRLKDIITEN